MAPKFWKEVGARFTRYGCERENMIIVPQCKFAHVHETLTVDDMGVHTDLAVKIDIEPRSLAWPGKQYVLLDFRPEPDTPMFLSVYSAQSLTTWQD